MLKRTVCAGNWIFRFLEWEIERNREKVKLNSFILVQMILLNQIIPTTSNFTLMHAQQILNNKFKSIGKTLKTKWNSCFPRNYQSSIANFKLKSICPYQLSGGLCTDDDLSSNWAFNLNCWQQCRLYQSLSFSTFLFSLSLSFSYFVKLYLYPSPSPNML